MSDPKQVGSGIAAGNIEEFLDSAKNAAQKGMSQFYTPRTFGKLCAALLPDARNTIVDLNAGAGHLLFSAANKGTMHLLGIDIDARQSVKMEGDTQSVSRIIGDLTVVYPLLREVNLKMDLVTLNPPWDLHWKKDRLKELSESDLIPLRMAFNAVDPRLGPDLIDSTIATMLIGLDRMTTRGEGFIIANEATMKRLIFSPNAPYRDLAMFCWAYLSVKGNPMTKIDDHQWSKEGDFRTCVIWFAKGHIEGIMASAQAETNEEISDAVHGTLKRGPNRRGPSVMTPYNCNGSTADLFQAVREEWAVRNAIKKPQYNIWLNGDGTIGTYLSVFEECSFKIDKPRIERLNKLKGQRPMQLVMQAAQRSELMWAVNSGLWRVHPELPEKVNNAVLEYHAVRAPLTKLSPIQRLGYLDEEKFITCTKDLFLKDANGEMMDGCVEAAHEFIARPNRATWDAIANRVLYKGGKTVWQLVIQMEPDFQKSADSPDPEDLKHMTCECWNGEQCEKCQMEALAEDLSLRWKRVPKIETIKKLIHRVPVFKAGDTYELTTKGVRVSRTVMKPSLTWGEDEYQMNGMELAIWIKDVNDIQRLFMDRKHATDGVDVNDERTKLTVEFFLQDIAEHFEIPAVPSVAECHAEQFKVMTDRLNTLEEMLNDLPPIEKVA